MTTATFVMATFAAVTSTATLVVVLVGVVKGRQVATEAVQTVNNLKQSFKDAVAEL